MVSAGSFRGLLRHCGDEKAFTAGVAQRSMAARDVNRVVSEILQHWIDGGELQECELDALTSIVMQGIDDSFDGKVCLNEFVHTCSNTDTMTMQDMVMFFKSSRTRGC